MWRPMSYDIHLLTLAYAVDNSLKKIYFTCLNQRTMIYAIFTLPIPYSY
jgi:hypothetical protein